jgi:protein tyrosine phosphatase
LTFKLLNVAAGQVPKSLKSVFVFSPQNVRSIVMLTAEFEGRREKCTRYWPDGESQHGDISVALKETVEPSAANGYTVRTFAVARRQVHPDMAMTCKLNTFLIIGVNHSCHLVNSSQVSLNRNFPLSTLGWQLETTT